MMYSNCRYEVFVRLSIPRKPGQYVVKAVRINSPKCSFFKVARWFDFTNFIIEKKIHSNMLFYTQKWVIHWYFKFWVFTFWNLPPKIKCRMALTKFFWPRFSCISVSFIWLGTPPVVLQFILLFFHFVVCNCLFEKYIGSHSDIGKMTECFWQYVSLKIINFLLWRRKLILLWRRKFLLFSSVKKISLT